MILLCVLDIDTIKIFTAEYITMYTIDEAIKKSRKLLSEIKEDTFETFATMNKVDLHQYAHLSEQIGEVFVKHVEFVTDNITFASPEKLQEAREIRSRGHNAIVKVNVEYFSPLTVALMNIKQTIENSQYGKATMLDLTEIIKILNAFEGMENSFEYNRMFRRTTPSFFGKKVNVNYSSMKEYNIMIKKEKKELNSKVELTEKMKKTGKNEIQNLVEKFFSDIPFKLVEGKFENDKIWDSIDGLKIIRTFAERNRLGLYYNIVSGGRCGAGGSDHRIVEILNLDFSDYDYDGAREKKEVSKKLRKNKGVIIH